MRIAIFFLFLLIPLTGCRDEAKVKGKAPGVDVEVQQKDKVKVDVTR